MTREVTLKKRILFISLYLLIVIGVALLLCDMQYKKYIRNYNRVLNELCLLAEEKGGIPAAEILNVINSDSESQRNFFAKYGIDINAEASISNNREAFEGFLVITAVVFAGLAACPLIYVIIAEQRRNSRIRRITGELSSINKGDYSYNMDTSAEGSISILENELYKTAITLKESAENSKKDKESLKESLSDVSHQLKTPLTSLLINLENLEEYPDLPKEKRMEILKHAKRDVNKVNQMVQLLLKLSRFDANAIEFEKKPANVSKIITAAAENVEALCDLKGIELVKEAADDANGSLNCDAYWETEALTNILKNGIEHAETTVSVRFRNCELYSEIIVENDGEPISDEAARNAFNRFYRGENAAEDSVGIGLALANAIVKHDGGYIIAEGTDNGTRFTMRYTG